MCRFKCNFPECNYETNHRNLIHSHHIVPRELGGSNKKCNLVYLCPNCHQRIYIHEVKSGMHSIHTSESIILHRWVTSTTGRLLEFTYYGNDRKMLWHPMLQECVN